MKAINGEAISFKIVSPFFHIHIANKILTNSRDNLDWLARATNWGKFTATSSLGVIHKV